MKPRRVMLMLELETDVPIKEFTLKSTAREKLPMELFAPGQSHKENIVQVQANVVKLGKKLRPSNSTKKK